MKKRHARRRRRPTPPRGPISIVGPSSVGGVFGDEVVTATIMPAHRDHPLANVDFSAVDEVYARMSQCVMDAHRERVEREGKFLDALIDGRLVYLGWQDRGPVWGVVDE